MATNTRDSNKSCSTCSARRHGCAPAHSLMYRSPIIRHPPRFPCSRIFSNVRPDISPRTKIAGSTGRSAEPCTCAPIHGISPLLAIHFSTPFRQCIQGAVSPKPCRRRRNSQRHAGNRMIQEVWRLSMLPQQARHRHIENDCVLNFPSLQFHRARSGAWNRSALQAAARSAACPEANPRTRQACTFRA